MRIRGASRKVLAVMIATATLAMAGCTRGASSVPVTPGWTRHTSPAGLVFDVPAGWRVDTGAVAAAPSAAVTLASPGGEQVIFWPLSPNRSAGRRCRRGR